MKRNMMALGLFLTILGSSLTSTAQKSSNQTFEKGSITASVGVGLAADYKYRYASDGFGTKAVLEFGAFNAGPGVLSLGVQVGGAFSAGGTYLGQTDYRSRIVVTAVRSAWHNNWNVSRLDTYAGAAAGVGFRHYDYAGNSPYSKNDAVPYVRAFLGASYYFSPGFGVNVEVGNDITYAQAGIVFKLR